MLRRARDWARRIKRDVVALWLAARDPHVPLVAKLLAAIVAAYALSPLDLVPDFIPILGYLDDVILVPLGILAVVRLVPPPTMARLRGEADAITTRPGSRAGAVAVVLIWIAAAGLCAWWLLGPDHG
ncbi:YkvA family protein [Methylobrevis pamukkalensis]|uniref:YkvA family protein n=1 Tax=Methylobrevis pamukkalensis TaxID=1439726 RepID=UPI001FD9D4BA|nr:YkvA family protein [Methylobrevis pamukkalensis]